MILQLLFSQPFVFFGWAVAMILAISVHEFAHAAAATSLGDQTARLQGRLTLNPLSHLDLIGTILMLTIGFGWGKPVPFNPYNLKYQRFGPAMVSLAGPISNLFMVTLGVLALKFLFPLTGFADTNGLHTLLTLFIMIDAVLMVFNFIPLPPLDGSKAFFALMPRNFEGVRMFLERYGTFILIGLLLFLPGVFDAIFTVTLNVINWFVVL